MFVNGYSDLSVSKAGIRPSFMPAPSFGAHFSLDRDVSPLFPYINAILPHTRYFKNPVYIQFGLDDTMITLYPHEVIAGPFADQAHAEKFADRLIAYLNDLHARKDTLSPNHKTFKSISAIDVFKLLPGTNCRECGFATCLAFAAALSKGRTSPDKCPGFESPISERAVYPVYDSEGNVTSTVAIEIEKTRSDAQEREQDIETESHRQERPSLLNQDTAAVRTGLTDRELQVLRLVAEGATNTEISDQLSISPHTVKSHVVHIFNKLGVNDRTQAAVWATRYNLI